MESTQQGFYGLLMSGELVRAVGKVLETWSTKEDAEILATYRTNGANLAWTTAADELVAAIERGEPEAVTVNLTTYTVAGRVYTPNPMAPGPSTPRTLEALGVWVDEKSPDSMTVVLSVTRPSPVSVTLQGGNEWASATADAGNGGFWFVQGFESKISPEVFLDEVAAAVTPFVQPNAADPLGNRVFLGHGHGSDWKILEEKIKAAGYEPQAFEGAAGAGDVNLYVIDTTIRGSFAAVLYMTPDDRMNDGKLRARQNVIHEIGYAQGVLGIQNVVVVQNDDVETPTNIDGVNVVRFKTGALYDKLDEVVGYLQKIKASGHVGPYGGH